MPVVTRSMSRAAARYDAGYAIFQGYENYEDIQYRCHKNEILNFNNCLYEYCHQCSLNVNNIFSKRLKDNKQYQDIEKSVDFKRDLRSNEKKFIKMFKYLIYSLDTHIVTDRTNITEKSQCKDILCPACYDIYTKNFSVTQIKSRLVRLFKSNWLSRLYNKVTNKQMLTHYKNLIDKNKRFKEINKVKIREFNQVNNFPLSHLWKGGNYYHEKMFGIPSCLEDIDIPLEHYTLKKKYYLNDSICGHVLASDGWYQESLQNIIDLFQKHDLEFK